uniref:ODAD1 central coiled coil region domain-containing protein n=1 Tax=Alexandrium monilatum TaxID=311494 RepID=A0A6T1AB17_9DINO|mmetsp:Transcript_55987/g.175676  ORF Transcript_55987/g.175676 Transcript_55987/m.175676 type:complete len:550 (-) Transcript_55987:76-1725(-)
MAMFKKKKDEDRKPIEVEIQELQRKFRVLENDKRACSEDSQGTIRKQRATIEKLTRENRKMKVELNETRSVSGTAAENKMALETIAKLAEQSEGLQRRMESEAEGNRTLQEEIEDAQRQIFSLREDMGKVGGVNAAQDNVKAVQKQIRILENRLDHGMHKFNDAITANRSLREQIDTLRRERVVFDDIYRKLNDELLQKKNEMANIIDQANSAYEARDSAQAQMASLKQQADKEHAEFEKEWKELGKLIENDKRMKEFMKAKLKSKDDKTQDSLTKDEDKLKKKITRNGWDSANSLVTITANQEKVASYEEAFARIQAATGICDIDELVQNFINAEDTNFSLFNYNNELSADIEKLEQQIAEYQEEYVMLSGSSSRKEDTEKAKILETLEEKWNDIDRKAISYEVKHHESQQTLSHVRTCIESIFRRLGCTPEDLPSGCGNSISEANMMQYLAIIEQRSAELLKLHDGMRQDDDDLETTKPSRSGYSSANVQINRLPSTVEDYSDDEDDDDDDDSRPFTKEELKSKTLKNISKKGKKTKMRSGAAQNEK